ncbi:MAG: hypothetical protein ACI8U3_001297 [Brevundimonas sp.]|jgi:hypothetical protein|uniref:hypothetical protein n=1 Tax=Brevundimonas sp. TaxID=1871086 RepID=UPI0039E375BC
MTDDAVRLPEAPEDLLTRAEASAELARFGIRMNVGTLARAWSTGTPSGPPCRHIRGRPFYPRRILHAWAEAQISELASSARERDLQKRRGRPC